MGKTVQIDDDVMRAAEKLAAERGSTPDAVVSDVARKALLPRPDVSDAPPPAGAVLKNGWYVLPARGERVSSELVRRLLDEADLEDAGIKRSE